MATPEDEDAERQRHDVSMALSREWCLPTRAHNALLDEVMYRCICDLAQLQRDEDWLRRIPGIGRKLAKEIKQEMELNPIVSSPIIFFVDAVAGFISEDA